MCASNDKQPDACTPTALQVCAIVVLFYPDADFGARRLLAIQDIFSAVVLVDNTPGGAVLPELPAPVQVLSNSHNLGIAAALNLGLDCAIAKGYEWIATFDQDSDVFPDYLETVVTIAGRRASSPVLIGCNYLNGDAADPFHAPPAHASGAWPRPTLITSGTFIPARFARSIGGFREDFFIDSVDHEFCLRARRHGAAVLMTTRPLMRHRMGNAGVGVFGLRFSLQHPPARRYYMARNTLTTIRAHGISFPFWALRQICRLMGEGLAIVLFESEKRSKIYAFSRGLWHGLIGRRGSLEEA